MKPLLLTLSVAVSSEAAARRVNKAIELLNQGQPVYYTTSRGGYLNSVNVDDVEAMIEEGVMIGAAASREAAEKGRRYTRHPAPW